MPDPRGFQPRELLEVLERYEVDYVLIGGLAATLWGSPHVTFDVDIAPSPERANLSRLARALEELDARIRVEGEPDGLPFDRSPAMLARTSILNLTTRFGPLDICFEPSGTHGFADLMESAVEIDIRGLSIAVASLADIIRSKQASGWEKDRLVLPTLRALQAKLEG